jgi:hypothetical protein
MSRIYFYSTSKKNVEIVTIFVISENLPTFVLIIGYSLWGIRYQLFVMRFKFMAYNA